MPNFEGYGYVPDLREPDFGSPGTIGLFNKKEYDSSGDFSDKEIRREQLRSGQASAAAGGGLGGALTSAGVTGMALAPSGMALAGANPYLVGGGLILSAIEKRKAEKAAKEQAQIDAEMQRRNNLIQLARDAANQDFRIA